MSTVTICSSFCMYSTLYLLFCVHRTSKGSFHDLHLSKELNEESAFISWSPFLKPLHNSQWKALSCKDAYQRLFTVQVGPCLEGLPGGDPPDTDPLDRDPPDRDPSRQKPHRQRCPWETPLQKEHGTRQSDRK